MNKNFMRMLFAVLFIIISGVSAGDMTLTLDDGTDIILHEDKTWGYSRGVHEDPAGDVVITLDDNRNVLIGSNYTWKFVDKATASAATRIYKTIYEFGTAENIHLEKAKAQAMGVAMTRTVNRLRPIVGKGVSVKKLTGCIEQNEYKEIESDEKFGKQWKVKIKITIDQMAIESIRECVAPPAVEKEKTAAPVKSEGDVTE